MEKEGQRQRYKNKLFQRCERQTNKQSQKEVESSLKESKHKNVPCTNDRTIKMFPIFKEMENHLECIKIKTRPVKTRDSGNDFRFPDLASHTGRFRLIFVRISSIVSFRVDI